MESKHFLNVSGLVVTTNQNKLGWGQQLLREQVSDNLPKKRTHCNITIWKNGTQDNEILTFICQAKWKEVTRAY